MSFMRTLATLAAGYAAAKGVEQYKKMGGMAGLQQAMGSAGQGGGLGDMMAKMGLPAGAADGLQGMLSQLQGNAAAGGDAAQAGLGGLMSAMMGAGAAGSEQASSMMDMMMGNTAATDAMEENAKLMIRAMIQAAKADGEIDAEERDKILAHLGEVSDEERAFVEEQLAAPVDVQALAQDTADAMKAQIYAVSAMAITVDSMAEAKYLDALGRALQLGPQTLQQIHASMGLPTQGA